MTPATRVARDAKAPVARYDGVLGGKAVITGTRVPVFMVEDIYRERGSVAAVRESYPQLEEQQVLGALFYASAHPDDVAADRSQYREAFKGTPLDA